MANYLVQVVKRRITLLFLSQIIWLHLQLAILIHGPCRPLLSNELPSRDLMFEDSSIMKSRISTLGNIVQHLMGGYISIRKQGCSGCKIFSSRGRPNPDVKEVGALGPSINWEP